MTLTCPDHGRVTPRLKWCRSDDGRLHLGAMCSRCNLWLKWLPADTRDAPPPKSPMRVEALR